MGLKWEFLGIQRLREDVRSGKGYVYSVSVWRTPVPGGWLLMSINSKSSDPQPAVSFYPDPGHEWNVGYDPRAATLLRPAEGAPAAGSASLLRAAEYNVEK